MKIVKQVMAVLVWCVVSVGCVAEEVKSGTDTKSAEAIKQSEQQLVDKPNISPSGAVINVQEDELYFVDEFRDIVFKCNSDQACAFLFDNLIVYFGPYYTFHKRDSRDSVYWPVGLDRNNYKNYIGGKVEVYCKKTRGEDDVSFVMKGGIKEYESKNYPGCTTQWNNKKYFIRFIE